MNCTFPGCDRLAHARGLCVSHYAQRRRGIEMRPIDPSEAGRLAGKARSEAHRPLLERVSALSRGKMAPMAQALALGLRDLEQLYQLRLHARRAGLPVDRLWKAPATTVNARKNRARYARCVAEGRCIECRDPMPDGDTRRRCEPCRAAAERRRGARTTMGERRITVGASDRCSCGLLLPCYGPHPSIYAIASRRDGSFQ